MAPHCHIILVDDEISVAELLKAVIKRVCPTVNISLATNGQKALQLFEQFGADLIISDKDMPVMDGLELTRALRARGVTIPIILMSGTPDSEQVAHKAGATLFLSKPEIITELPPILPHLLS